MISRVRSDSSSPMAATVMATGRMMVKVEPLRGGIWSAKSVPSRLSNHTGIGKAPCLVLCGVCDGVRVREEREVKWWKLNKAFIQSGYFHKKHTKFSNKKE